MIELKNITKTYQDGAETIQLLKPTNLSIGEKEFIAITGPSGSGKSTLLTIIGALQHPTEGSLFIQQQDVYALSETQRSNLRLREIGFVLQGSNLVPYLTIYDQYVMKLKQAKLKDEARISELFHTLGIDGIKHKYPDSISGGERQRAAIGLALLLRPRIILADEPTASLDSIKAKEVAHLLQRVTQTYQTSVIMVTHDHRLLDECDRVLEMNDGILKEIQSN